MLSSSFFLVNSCTDLLLFHILMLWNHQRAEEVRAEKEISGAAVEHVAQSNQYFLVTAGISLRNKPSLINSVEKSQPNSNTSENSSY